jgi:hypothetical protein
MRADPAAGYVVPAVLRGARFVPWQAPGRREPARVSAGAFQAAGLPVPEHPGQRNIDQLTGRQGLAWTPGLDARSPATRAVGHGYLILVDIDVPAAADGSPLVNGALAGRPRGGGRGTAGPVGHRVRAHPGHPASGHLPRWHLWYPADPARPVHWARWAAAPSHPEAPAPDHQYLVRSPPMSCWPAWLNGWPGRPRTATATSTGTAARTPSQAGKHIGRLRHRRAANGTGCCTGPACAPETGHRGDSAHTAIRRSPAQPPRSGW